MGFRSRLKEGLKQVLGVGASPRDVVPPARDATAAPRFAGSDAPATLGPGSAVGTDAEVVAPGDRAVETAGVEEAPGVAEAEDALETAPAPREAEDVAEVAGAEGIADGAVGDVAEAADPEPPQADAEVASAGDPPRVRGLQLGDASDAPLRESYLKGGSFTTTAAAHNVRLVGDGIDRVVPCEPGEFVLDAADRAGIVLPSSCRNGGCLTCTGRLVSGDTEMEEQYTLEEEHISVGFRLLCITRVTSDAEFLTHQQEEVE